MDSLVEQNDVGFPDFLRHDSNDVDLRIVARLPLQLIVIPQLQQRVKEDALIYDWRLFPFAALKFIYVLHAALSSARTSSVTPSRTGLSESPFGRTLITLIEYTESAAV